MTAALQASPWKTARIEEPEGDDAVWSLGAINPLCALAAPLLVLAMRLRDASAPADLDAARVQAIAAVRTFETAALESGLPTERMRVARFLLCATVDDVVALTEWGGRSHWASHGLLGSIEEDPWGGERYLGAVEQALADPVGSIEMLELAYLCLAMGFAGRYRVMPRGGAELATLRDRVYRAIRRVRGEPDRPLSPQWRGLTMPYAPPARPLPILTAFVGGLLLLAGLFAVFSLDLTWRADRVSAQMQSLFPPGDAAVARPARPESRVTQIERIRQALAVPPAAGQTGIGQTGIGQTGIGQTGIGQTGIGQIGIGQVEIGQDDRTITLRIAGGGLFAGGSARISPAFIPLLDQIAAALSREPGRIGVVGHTDDVPLRPSGPLDSNLALSQARAEATAERLRAALGALANGDGARVTASGRGSAEPLASNGTPEGRALNRRIEILLPREGASAP